MNPDCYYYDYFEPEPLDDPEDLFEEPFDYESTLPDGPEYYGDDWDGDDIAEYERDDD